MNRRISKADVTAVVILLLAYGLFGPILLGQNIFQSRELANRSTCAANIRGIAMSMMVYAADENGAYPVVPGTSSTTYDTTFKPVAPDANVDKVISSVYGANRTANNPMQNLWLLVLKGQVATKQFICKSDAFATEPSVPAASDKPNYYTNFQNSNSFSYSTAYPWTGNGANVVIGGIWRDSTDASLPLLSDMAPSLSAADAPADEKTNTSKKLVVRLANSYNHQLDGQNVAYGDAHAEFNRRPDIGQNNDSIWGIWVDPQKDGEETTIAPGKLPHAPGGKPSLYDVVMVPTRDASGKLK